jgi:hypothetical protein
MKEIERDAAELVVKALGALRAEPRDTGGGVQAAKADNQAKLAACLNAPRRHLYVGLTSAGEPEGMAWWALLDVLERGGEMPPIPALPEAITTVWAGTGTGAIWVTPPGPWHLYREPAAT